MLNSYRKNDPVIHICQNNAMRMVEICALNAEAEKIIGYTSDELLKQPLGRILPERINNTVSDIIEFEAGARDISDALLKCREFSILNKNGQNIPCRIRIVRTTPSDKNEWFQIVLVREENALRNEAFRDILRKNFKGHETLDERTGLPNHTSMLKDLELTLFHVNKKDFPACLALISIDKFEQYSQDFGDDIALELYKYIAGISRRTLRSDDTLSTVNDYAMGAILIDTNRESARMASNRLRWTIAAAPMVLSSGMQIPVSVSITYTEVNQATSAGELLSACENKMKELRADALSASSLHFIMGKDRRAGKDRRQKSVPVANDRRKGDRRQNP